jgi:TolB-like protein/DNA-binding winged helix-turn-helix (wHTH) protein/Flp pilus assembly protein TadD
MRDVPDFDGVRPSREVASVMRFAGLVYDLDACTLARDSGEAIALTRGEFALLRMFVTRPGRFISRDTLLDAFTKRRFEPFDRSIDVLVWRLRRKIESDPKRPRLIVTVPGEGYRFDGLRQSLSSQQKPFIAVLASQDDDVSPDSDPESDPPLPGAAPSVRRAGRAAMPAPDPPEPPRLSIVVLPFANIGGDPEQEYFTDGVTDGLTTDLSRIRGAFVIGRSTAITYKAEAVDVRQIGRDLNVRYALEGSVQRSGTRMRLNVQLLDAETGNHLWADRFDKALGDLFDMQDEIATRLAGALDAQLVAAEAQRAETAPTPDSVDFYFQGLAWFNRGITPDNVARARGFFDRALSIDPDYVDALVGSAGADVVDGTLLFAIDRIAAFEAAEAKLTKALSSVPDHARGHMWLGVVNIFIKRAAEGIAECEHALALDRNLASARAMIGYGKIFIGRAEETETHIAEALRLSPRDTLAYIWMSIAGDAKNHLGSREQAVEWFRQAIKANRNYPTVHFNLAAALALLGRLNEAHSAVKAGLALNPSFSISRARAARTVRSDDPIYLSQLESILEGLREAGVPEG